MRVSVLAACAISVVAVSSVSGAQDRLENLNTRFGYLREYIEKWQVNGVILLLTRNCDPHGYEVPAMKRFLDDNGLPSIYLEHVYSESGTEALKTRIEAFVEMIG